MNLHRIKIIFNEILNLILTISKTFKVIIVSLKEKALNVLKKQYFLWFVKLLCFSLLSYHSIQLTFEYLSFKYNYKLIVSDYKQGIDFPNLTVCTDTNIFFDDQKFIQVFNVSDKVKEDHYSNHLDFWSEKFETIKNSSTFKSMLGLTIEPDQFIEIYGQFHNKNDLKTGKFSNFSEIFQIMRSIYGNQDFGICYKFLSKNRNIYLKDNDFIQINIKEIKRFSDLKPSIVYKRRIYPYLIINENNRNTFESSDSSLYLSTRSNSEIKIRKSSLKFLSTPYMQECNDEGMFLSNLQK